MRWRFHIVFLLGLALIGLAARFSLPTWAGEGAPKAVGPYAPGRLIVGLRATSADRAGAMLAGRGLAVIKQVPSLDAVVVAVPVGEEAAVARQLRREPAVRYVEPDFLARAFDLRAAPDDPYYATDQWNLPQINAPAAWGLTTGFVTITIAIVDSGVDLSHPDLAGKIVPGYDFVNDDTIAQDDGGHGTHVAGIAAAATNNALGIAGVAWGARIMPVKVLDNAGSGSYSDVAAGIAWAADHGARIINLSLGGPGSSQLLQEAVDHAYGLGALVVAAAGNDYVAGSPINYPAACDHVVGVAATNDQDDHASYSSAGSWVDIAAPGGDPAGASDPDPRHWIMSTYWRAGQAQTFEVSETSKVSSAVALYERNAGTSMASPHVAGLAALVWSRHPGWTPDQVEWAIASTARDRGAPGRDDRFGWGRIDAHAAVAVETLRPTPTPVPSNCLIESAHPYPHDSTGAWTVQNPDTAAAYTKLHFSRLETERGYDYVILKDAQGAEIERLDGTYRDGLWSKPVPGNIVRVELRSDSSIALWGFCVDQLVTSGPPPWMRRAALTVARSRLAVAAAGGNVYAIGGESSAPVVASAAVAPGVGPQALDAPAAMAGIVAAYDPATNAWTGKTAMPVGLSNISAAAIDDKIYVPGGFDSANASAALQMYDPISDTWTLRAPLPAARYAAAVAAVAGRLYVFGGIGPTGTDNACLVYDPAADAWSACAPLPDATAWGAAGVVGGKIYVAGGATVSNTEVSMLYAYDPATDQWAVRSPMGVARSGLAVVGYGDYLYAIGGGWATYLPLAERFDPAVNRWQTADPMDVGRRSLAAAELGGKLYAVGGYRDGYSNVVEAYTPPGPAQYPTVEVAPSTFEAHLTDQLALQSVLTISNTGQAELTFTIRDTETTSPTHVTIHLPPRVVSAVPPGARSPVEVKTLPAQDLRVPFGLRQASTSSGIKVLIVTPDGDVSDLVAVLAAFPNLAVEVFDLSRAPSLAELRLHDVVLTTNNWTWPFGGINPVELGNVLADYVDGGGKVVVGNYGYDFSVWAIQGRFIDQDYGPFGRATADLGYAVTLGAYLQEHPIMQGVTNLAETAIHQDPLALASATLVASWSDGTPLVAAKPRVVGVNLLLSGGAGYARWSGDVPTLLHNIVVWLASGGATGDARWLDQAPAVGSVPPGSSVPVTVTFSRIDLGGGIYTADMLIKSNDPWRGQIGVPVTMTVHIGPLDRRLYLPVMFDPFR